MIPTNYQEVYTKGLKQMEELNLISLLQKKGRNRDQMGPTHMIILEANYVMRF
jgi:hypothetical protein